MQYLTLFDILQTVEQRILNQLAPDISILDEFERVSYECVFSYLSQKYDIVTELRPSKIYDPRISYNADDRVYLFAPNYVNTTIYNTDDLATANGVVYQANTDNISTLPTATNPDWQQLGKLYSFSQVKSDVEATQAGSILDPLIWTKGDTRNAKIREVMVDVLVYNLYSKASPQNIPRIVILRYDGESENQTGGAIGWLKGCMKGNLNTSLPKLVPTQGTRIRFGGSTKNTNTY